VTIKRIAPLHGWRAFIGEVGVVVLGVLLALGAQQVAQDIQMRTDERAFRETIDHEIGLNLFVYDVRARQFGCNAKQIGELRDWLNQARTGAKVPAIHPGAPLTMTPYRSAWDNRDANVFNHLPQKVRQKYAEFYDEVASNWLLVQSERQSWLSLWKYAEPGPIALEDRRVIRPALADMSGYNSLLDQNFVVSRKIAEELNIKELEPDNMPQQFLQHAQDCRSVIAPAGS
jgi:hypothetical protein